MTTFPIISYRQFDEWPKQGKVAQLVDLQESRMYEHDRLWGSMNTSHEELECNMDFTRGNSTVVFYCDQGVKGMVVCRDLWRLGYDVVDPVGGMLNYQGKYIGRSPASAVEQKL